MPRAASTKLGDLGDRAWRMPAVRPGDDIGNRRAGQQTILKSATLSLGLLLNATTTLAIPAEAAVSLTDAATAERGPWAPSSHLSRRLAQDSGTICRIACIEVLNICVGGCLADENDQCAFKCRTAGAACRRRC
jgi:hypothetical protein